MHFRYLILRLIYTFSETVRKTMRKSESASLLKQRATCDFSFLIHFFAKFRNLAEMFQVKLQLTKSLATRTLFHRAALGLLKPAATSSLSNDAKNPRDACGDADCSTRDFKCSPSAGCLIEFGIQ